MSDYSSTFTESTGDTIDVADFTAEFDSLETAVNSKMDEVSGSMSDPTITGIAKVSVETGLTAHVGQAQGGTPLTKAISEITTSATALDSVTLPTAVAGLVVYVLNYGAESVACFPALGDDLGAGVNTSQTITSDRAATYVCISSSKWARTGLQAM